VLPQVLVEIQRDLTLEMKPIQIMDHSKKELRNKRILVVKILWRSSQVEEQTWKRE
jgi:hypothetical protein